MFIQKADNEIRSSFQPGVEAPRPLFQDDNGFLWIASFNGGLFPWDGYELKHFPARPGGLSHGTIGDVLIDPDNSDVFWVGTWGGGLNR